VRKSLHCDCEQEKWGHAWVSVCVHRGASICQIYVTKCDFVVKNDTNHTRGVKTCTVTVSEGVSAWVSECVRACMGVQGSIKILIPELWQQLILSLLITELITEIKVVQ
jgi:hypothetical protein